MIDNDILTSIKKYMINDAKENKQTNNNYDLQSALLLMELMELIEKAPEHCRVHLLKYAIHNTELVLQTRDDRNDCYQCLDECAECEKIKNRG